jgi:UDP-N-acetylmuramate: L-alanyl-gamma-D-glutamyl-meso-diaminopimelate ligase
MKKAIERVHLIGIAGTGMGAFAGLLKAAGYAVEGSDTATYPPMSDKLKEWGIEVKMPYAASNLDPAPDLVIVGNVASKDNVEAAYAREHRLNQMSFPQALHDLFLTKAAPVVVAGTHGKTTSSALLAFTLWHSGRDPGFLIGGILQNFGESFRLREAPTPGFFVVEGDEYDTAYFDKGPKFLHYAPKYLLATSLEYDHADIYQNVEQIVAAFSKLFSIVQPTGFVMLRKGAPHLEEALQRSACNATVMTYGPGGDLEAANVDESAQGLSFDVKQRGQKTPMCRLKLQLSGMHNVDNALGCFGLLRSMGLSQEEIAAGFAAFRGVKRRMEEIGEVKGILVVDDFAHHPTAVKTTIEGAKHRYAGRPIWALFEPRSASSCRKVFQNDYANAFMQADRVLLAPPGRLLGEDIMLDVPQLASDVSAAGVPATAFTSIDDMVQVVVKSAPKNAVILCMSNGGFGGIHQKILDGLRTRATTD